MFHEDDEIFNFLEETMEINIPEEILKDKNKTIKEIEKNLKIKIPKKYNKKGKLNKFLKIKNKEYKNFINKNRPKKLLKFIYVISILLISTFYLLKNISKNTNYVKIKNLGNLFKVSIYIVIGIAIFISIYYLICKIKKGKYKLGFKNTIYFIIILVYTGLILILNSNLYHNNKFKDFIIKESMNTINHQYIANLFYNNRIIENSLSKYIVDDSLYEFENINYEVNKYANPYDEEILIKDNEEDIYKIIKIEGTLRDGINKYSGFMAVVYDPANLQLGISAGAGTDEKAFGQILSQISKNNDALVAINAGGFYDPEWRSNGGIPHGTVIKNGKILTDYVRGIESGGLIGITKENKLILKRMTAEEAIEAGVRDAVDWGPYLIVNGKNLVKDNDSKWACARTVIGQRKDGIILLLVIDGGQPHSFGASYKDLADIMEKYGAINAANLDGGTSTAMTVNHEYINIPFNGIQRTIRKIPNGWIVTKEKAISN